MITAREDRRVDEAASIWASATCAREGDPEIPALSESRPLIEAVLGAPRSLLVLALALDGGAVGFAAIEPESAAEPATAKVRYVAVDPAWWGRGVGRTLMGALPEHLRGLGYTRAWLSVYIDNARGIALYESAGWRAREGVERNPRSGRPERYFESDL